MPRPPATIPALVLMADRGRRLSEPAHQAGRERHKDGGIEGHQLGHGRGIALRLAVARPPLDDLLALRRGSES
jgi:hypothetical protein